MDLVLLDVNLPDMSGLDLARTLRARGETVDLLVITAHRDVATVRAASTLGVVGYLIKPFTYAVFEEKKIDPTKSPKVVAPKAFLQMRVNVYCPPSVVMLLATSTVLTDCATAAGVIAAAASNVTPSKRSGSTTRSVMLAVSPGASASVGF